MLRRVLLIGAIAAASSLNIAPSARAGNFLKARRSAPCVASIVDERPPDEPEGETPAERKARLEELGRKAAAEASFLDSASADDGGLMAEFNSRLDKEGGKTVFELKTSASAVGEGVKETADSVKNKAADLADSIPRPSLNEQQSNILKVPCTASNPCETVCLLLDVQTC